jgi:murein DD-endopeptidase MepM/ murein hydrolase activator NlpD
MRKSILVILIAFALLFPQPVTAQASGPVYIVQPGDTLTSIAKNFNVTLDELMAANGITNPDLVNVGEYLVIPGLEGLTGVLDTQVIGFGDSFRSLVRRTRVPMALLQKLNHIISPSELYVGVRLIVPKQENAPAPLTTHVTPKQGETLLELAVRQGSDQWTLQSLNGLAGTWDVLPGDTLYSPVGAGDASPGGFPSAFLSAEMKNLPLKQGGTAEIIVKVPDGTQLGGLLIDHPLHFFPLGDGRQVAMQGAHANLEPGAYPLRLDATLPDGSVQSYEQLILIGSGNYQTIEESLPVDPSYIDPTVTEPEQKQLEEITLPSTSTKYWDGQFISPAVAYADSTYYTSRYGTRRVYIGEGTDLKINWWHTGLDFGGGTGLSITAPARGRVVFAGPWIVRGNTTIIDHGWGVYSGFWHQSKINVQVNDIVEQGQVIGEVGGTGRVTGPHLHWEIWVNGVQVDPLDWLVIQFP